MKTLSRLAVVVLAAPLAVVALEQPATAHGDSGQRDCTGSGKVVVVASYQVVFGGNVQAKKLGPVTSETWSAGLPKNTPAPVDQIHRIAFVTPYAAAFWSAYSEGPAISAGSQCNIKPIADGTPDGWMVAGSKTCADGKDVIIAADGFGDIWVEYINDATDKRHRIKFSKDLLLTTNDVDTGVKSVRNAVVKSFNAGDHAEDAVQYASFYCR